MAGNGDGPGESYLLQYLPEVYRGDPFLARFLLIFEDILAPIERTLDSMTAYFDPATTRPEVLEWLGSWLGIALDERWPLGRRRTFVRKASTLFAQRGTRRGLSVAIEALTGVLPQIVEATVADLAADPTRQFSFQVTLPPVEGEAVDRDALEALIEFEKPAFASYSLEIQGEQVTLAPDRRTPGPTTRTRTNPPG